ncbi:16S rRNA (guanine(966)-N(2))-methyltransferase RsmD [Thiosulfativibrio zosterae]|uniref:Ribosomal RNA small subunit methyltransferase D n=1 Tax=Thiosulfativibrio zosterae TaxID=2675053 RepID=A0A6F8PKD4_9GAMM|nr:16S rRNA (guanine(966)-N(2))-methyltransferase RsmD [Thiosulfativibrio zosterae]BBP42517.1 ribosomal RNA small subunit methyltransferase D [Thiosulfativibrio zosterae]
MARSHRSTKPPKSASHAPTPLGQVRIIGGEFRGRKLPVRQAEGLRPTSDRVKETVFNWLQYEVPRATCLDAFAGSGALGFEALSRGADQVFFLELDAANAQQLKQNLHTLKTDKAQIVQTNSLTWLNAQPATAFDIIFLDPPFHQDLMQPAIDLIFAQNWLKNNHAWLYLEQEKALDWPKLPEGWVCHREKTTSQVRFGLFKREQAPSL